MVTTAGDGTNTGQNLRPANPVSCIACSELSVPIIACHPKCPVGLQGKTIIMTAGYGINTGQDLYPAMFISAIACSELPITIKSRRPEHTICL